MYPCYYAVYMIGYHLKRRGLTTYELICKIDKRHFELKEITNRERFALKKWPCCHPSVGSKLIALQYREPS